MSFADLSNKRRLGLNKYITLFCEMKLRDKLRKEVIAWSCSVKKVLLKISQNLYLKTTVLESLFNKNAGLSTEIVLKRDSNTGVFG